MGPPGAGKGTQSDFIIEKYQIPHIATGDMFRAAIKNETKLGLEAKSYMDAGKLVPDEVTINIVKERLLEDDTKNGFIFDGFPRTIVQAQALDKMLKELNRDIDVVINIDVPFDVLLKRLSGRRICKVCGTSYHLEFNPPQVAGICDKCGGELYTRSDDNEESARVRLETYTNETKPLIEYYLNRGLLNEVNGLQAVDKVFIDINNIIEGIK
jgi:adenylate kinase